jgi:putative cardiolipin synthase
MINKILLALFITLVAACASLPDNTQQEPSYALDKANTMDTRLATVVMKREQADMGKPGETGIHLLDSGHDAFVARAVLAQKADKTLDVQYYLYHNDLSGKILLAQLLDAADRGVRVRLLVDDMDLARADIAGVMIDDHANFEVRVWNPFIRGSSRTAQFVTRFGSVTRRMHNKTFTADNQIAIVGGRNIGNEYFGADPDVSFRDLDAILIGDVVEQVSGSFDQYWNHKLAYPITTLHPEKLNKLTIQDKRLEFDAYIKSQEQSVYADILVNSDLAAKLQSDQIDYQWGRAEIFADSPDKTEADRDRTDLHLISKLAPILFSAEKELLIVSPYFVPGKQGTKMLTGLVNKGVVVKVLTNSLASNDVEVVHAGYSRYRIDLLRGGVQLYEMNSVLKDINGSSKAKLGLSKSSLHAKYFVIDRNKSFVGSLNLDPRSVKENTEIGVMVYNEIVSRDVAEYFDTHIMNIAYKLQLQDGNITWTQKTDAGIMVLETEPNSTIWQRLKVGFMSYLPGESQL